MSGCLPEQCHYGHRQRGTVGVKTARSGTGRTEDGIQNSRTITNLIIAGIGRQGINSLAKVLARVCHESGLACQYTVHKGGAQSLGSVYAELRTASAVLPVVGPGIPAGKLDILVALDPWEAVRHLHLGHSGTICYVETEIMPFFTDRSGSATAMGNPIEQLKRLALPITWRQYRQDAIADTGTAAMSNYYAGLDCLNALGLNVVADYQRIFFTTIPAAQQRTML